MSFSVQAFGALLPVYKPKGWTSNDVVRKIKGLLQRNNLCDIKVGHGGTLDPIAEGVLVLGLGEGTKQMDRLLSGRKVYVATARFGTSTDTLDITGSITAQADHSFITTDLLERALLPYIGNIKQVPPMYSSLKVKGVRLYNYARKGIVIDRPPRTVTVNRISVIDASPDWAKFEIDCEGGFYVRSFIDDLACSIGTKAHMSELIRVSHGQWTVPDCLILDENLNMNSILKKQLTL